MMPLLDSSLPALVRAIEEHYDLRVLDPPAPLSPGVHSQAWLVTTRRGRWVAKLSNPISDPVPKLERLTQLSLYLNQHAIRAPQFLQLRAGGYVGALAIGQRRYPLQLMRYEALSRVQPGQASEATLALIGELAARLHQALDSYPGRDAFIADLQKSANEWGAQAQGFWSLLQDLPDRALIPGAEKAWLRDIDQRALAYIRQQYPDPSVLSLALLHGDLNFEHVQFLADGTPYLFDFGDMCWGPIAHELAVLLLNTFCDGELSFAQWEALRESILNGYGTTRPIPALDRAMIPVFIVNRVVGQACYGAEYAHDAQLPLNWQDVKRTYTLAEYLLSQMAGA